MFVHTNFSTTGDLPIGVVHSLLPKTLQIVEVHDSNLRQPPSRIDQVWSHLNVLYIEFTALEHVHDTVFDLQPLQYLSLVGNCIVRLPPTALIQGRAMILELMLSGNPISVLPDVGATDAVASLQILSIEFTLVSIIPAWISRWTQERSGWLAHWVRQSILWHLRRLDVERDL